MKAITHLSVIVMLFVTLNSGAQTVIQDSLTVTDTLTINEAKEHSPNKAALFSAIVPGLGQAYNKKYWKVPVVYAAIGIPLYFAISNQKSFNKYKTAYGQRIDGDPNTVDEFDGIFTEAGLKSNVDYYQRNKDLSYILTGVFYLLNIVDAAVDAHLFNFPKNDNLSFNFQPNIELTSDNKISNGFKLVITL